MQYAAADLSAFYLDVLKDRLYCDAAAAPRRRSAQTVLHRIARDLCLLLAPVLPFTTDEAFPLLPGAAPGSVHLALVPRAREPADEALLARWGLLLDVRAEVNKALEEARAAKQMAASLEAKVVALRGPAEALAPLRAYDARARVFPGNLANLFIVSAGDPGGGSRAPLAVSVEHAPGRKCERCWTWSRASGSRSHPGVCERCAEVLAE